MSEEKQIEEIAKITIAHCKLDNQCGSCHWKTCNECLAEVLYNAGYRKQSEWISVDERLPEERELVFVYDTDTECVRWAIYNSTAEIWTSKRFTHWMPIPDAPAADTKDYPPYLDRPKSFNFQKKKGGE